MAIMKTLTVGSETYTVRDPEAVSFEQPQALPPMQQQTARGNIGAISMREAVDKLCPRIDESGPVVICEPMAGYSLEVVSHINNNPNILTDIWDAAKWTEDPMGFMIYETDIQSGEYIIYAEFDSSMPFMVHDYDEEGQWKGFELHSGIPKTFTHSGGVLRITDEYLIFKKVTRFCLEEYTVFTSAKLTQENGTDTRVFTIDLGQAVLGGSFNWTTGVLTDHNGNTYQLPAQEIPALTGVNTLYSDRGDTEVTGAGKPMQTDDTTVSAKPWSSKNTVDKLCPAFTESGAVVACEPVEGYPLEVAADGGETITRCGKNLIDPVKASKTDDDNRTTLDGDVFTTNFNSGGIHINRRYSPWCQVYPAGTYTFTLIPMTEGVAVSLFVYANSNGASIVSNRQLDASNPSYTFTAGEKCIPCLAGIAGSFGAHSYKLQLEAGSTATEYEPYKEAETFAPGEPITAITGVNTIYADNGNVTVTGKANPSAIIEKLTNAIISLGGNV